MKPDVPMPPLIALLTDFGTSDPYVGVMKGVILGICPTARIVDLCHEVPAQDIIGGALMLQAAHRYFREGTVFVAVVDPGVGSARRAIAAEAAGQVFVCPDNGILSAVARRTPLGRAVELANPEFLLPRVGHTFHGRDVFAPGAAHLAGGIELHTLGPPVEDLVTIPLSDPVLTLDGWIAHVLYIDGYGNAILDLPEPEVAGTELGGLRFTVAGHAIDGLSRSYADVPGAQALAVVGSWGYVEVAVRNGSARDRFGLCRGDEVTVRRVQ